MLGVSSSWSICIVSGALSVPERAHVGDTARSALFGSTRYAFRNLGERGRSLVAASNLSRVRKELTSWPRLK